MIGSFYSTKGPLGFCSNFYRAPIELDGYTWMTTEHFYQAQKTEDFSDFLAIQAAPSPKEAARLGRNCKIRECWDDIKYDVMLRAVRAKFNQNPELAEKLKETGNTWLVEDTVNSPRSDPVWGNGAAGEGRNWLGLILMQVRHELELVPTIHTPI